jgi:hypothetical protein
VPELIDVRADQIQARPIQWLWRNWIPLGKLVVVDGDPGLGKSTMLVDLAARLSRGRPMPDHGASPPSCSCCKPGCSRAPRSDPGPRSSVRRPGGSRATALPAIAEPIKGFEKANTWPGDGTSHSLAPKNPTHHEQALLQTPTHPIQPDGPKLPAGASTTWHLRGALEWDVRFSSRIPATQ